MSNTINSLVILLYISYHERVDRNGEEYTGGAEEPVVEVPHPGLQKVTNPAQPVPCI